MARNIQKSHSKFFKSLSLLMTLFVIGLMLTLTYYVINATISTNTQAAGNKCPKYSGNKKKCNNYGCFYGKNGVCSSNKPVENTNSEVPNAISNNMSDDRPICIGEKNGSPYNTGLKVYNRNLSFCARTYCSSSEYLKDMTKYNNCIIVCKQKMSCIQP